MGLEKIKEEILEKAVAAEKEILAEAAVKVNGIKRNVNDQTKQMEEEAAKKLVAELKAIENMGNSLANLEANKILFEAKKEIINRIYDEAFQRIKKMPKNERKTIIKIIFERAQKEIDVAVVYANDTDKEFIPEGFIVRSMNTEGGVVCETKDATIRVDYTFASIFPDLRERTIKETSKILFE